MDKGHIAIFLLGNILVCTVDTSSQKKGIGMAPAQFRCDDFYALTNIKWWYDWAASGVKQRNIHGCENFDAFVAMHIPMAWGNGSQFPNYNIQPTAEYLLGFNEPNHIAQSNLTPEQAYQLWFELENLATENNLLLVSPAAAPCGGDSCNADAEQWFDSFFSICEQNGGCRVDHVATHVYYCSPDLVMEYLQGLWDRYGKPIWVTEFACPYETDPQVQLDFMAALLPRLEDAPYIFRYAWYISRLTTDTVFVKTAVNLFKQGSPTLTTLGQFYNDFGESTATSSSSTPSTPSTTSSTPSSSSSSSGSSSSTSSNANNVSKPTVSKLCIVVTLFIYFTLIWA